MIRLDRAPVWAAATVVLLSAGCRGTGEPGEPPLQPPPLQAPGTFSPPPLYQDGPPSFRDSQEGPPHEFREDSPLLPVPETPPRTGSRRSMKSSNPAPISVPAPGGKNRANAPPMPTARRGTVLFPSEGDRGLMPSMFGRKQRQGDEHIVPESQLAEHAGSEDVELASEWPRESSSIERDFAAMPAPPRARDVVDLEGVEFVDHDVVDEAPRLALTNRRPDDGSSLFQLVPPEPARRGSLWDDAELVEIESPVDDTTGTSARGVDPDAPLPVIVPRGAVDVSYERPREVVRRDVSRYARSQPRTEEPGRLWETDRRDEGMRALPPLPEPAAPSDEPEERNTLPVLTVPGANPLAG